METRFKRLPIPNTPIFLKGYTINGYVVSFNNKRFFFDLCPKDIDEMENLKEDSISINKDKLRELMKGE